MKQIIESQEDDEEPEEISKPLVTEKPPLGSKVKQVYKPH